MSKGVHDLLIACTQSERDRAEYNAKLPPEEATLSDEEAEFMDAAIDHFAACEERERKAAGLSRLAWAMVKLPPYYKRNGWTEAQVLKEFRRKPLGIFSSSGPTYVGWWLTTRIDGPRATLHGVNSAIKEIKQAGLWPWEVVVIM